MGQPAGQLTMVQLYEDGWRPRELVRYAHRAAHYAPHMPVLQQLWEHKNTGITKWFDVPVEKEGDQP